MGGIARSFDLAPRRMTGRTQFYAGPSGVEPETFGFGDQRSAS